jgi:hypothetical protein
MNLVTDTYETVAWTRRAGGEWEVRYRDHQTTCSTAEMADHIAAWRQDLLADADLLCGRGDAMLFITRPRRDSKALKAQTTTGNT